MKTFRVAVTQWVDVTLDETKFDEAFMSGFRESFYPFDMLRDHAGHLAQLKARGVYDLTSALPKEFIEGYGDAGDMSLSAKIVDSDMEVIS